MDTWSINVSEVSSAANHNALEAEIAAYMQQRIEDGDLGAEDFPVRLARYGLMAPEAFADEMRERMGMADMPIFTVRTSRKEYDLGIHYDKAKDLAEEARYEGPFICFDAAEHGAILSAVQELGLVPQVVVVDMTDGQIHSIRCDAGEINGICYDTRDTDEHSAAAADRPLGENGEFVRCWAHAQLAEIDAGLKRARE